MGNVIPFERIKDVTGWSHKRIRRYVKDNGWKDMRFHLPTDDDEPVLIERLPG